MAEAALDPAEFDELRQLVDHVGRFYVRDKKMERAQAEITRAIGHGIPTVRERDRYTAIVRRYFDGFDREARAHLGDVEARLKRASQVQFNLTAERGVAASRIDAVQGVLARLANVRRA